MLLLERVLERALEQPWKMNPEQEQRVLLLWMMLWKKKEKRVL